MIVTAIRWCGKCHEFKPCSGCTVCADYSVIVSESVPFRLDVELPEKPRRPRREANDSLSFEPPRIRRRPG